MPVSKPSFFDGTYERHGRKSGILPRRLMVTDEDFERAKRLLADALQQGAPKGEADFE